MAKYTEEELKGYSIHTLRVILRSECGGVPGIMNKQDLIDEILNIQSGEKSPTRNPKGRKPLETACLPFDLDLNFSDIEYQEGKVERIKGVVFLEKQGYAVVLNQDCSHREKPICISKPMLVEFGLKNGDCIEGDAVYIYEKGGTYLKNIINLNGKQFFLHEERVELSTLSVKYPDKKFSIADDGSNENLKIADIFCPIGKGQRCIISGENPIYTADFVKNLTMAIKTNHSDVNFKYLAVEVKPEEETEIKEVWGDGLVSIPFGFSSESEVTKINLFTEVIKRALEHSNDLVVVVDGLSTIVSAYDEYIRLLSLSETEQTPKFESGKQFAKSIFSMAGNYADGVTLTLILIANEQDEILSAFESYATSVIKLKGRSKSKRNYFIDVEQSYTLKDDKLLSKEELTLVDEIKEKMQSAEDVLKLI